MDVIFDPAKDAANQAKHGLSLTQAADLDFASALIVVDDRFDYREERLFAVGYLGERLVALAFVELEPDLVRSISLRYATPAERRRYENA